MLKRHDVVSSGGPLQLHLSSRVSQHSMLHATRAPLMTRRLAGFRPGTRCWMASKASQITKRVCAQPAPARYLFGRRRARAWRPQGFLPQLTDLPLTPHGPRLQAAVGITDKRPETCRATATLIPYLPLIAIWPRLGASGQAWLACQPCCGTRLVARV